MTIEFGDHGYPEKKNTIRVNNKVLIKDISGTTRSKSIQVHTLPGSNVTGLIEIVGTNKHHSNCEFNTKKKNKKIAKIQTLTIQSLSLDHFQPPLFCIEPKTKPVYWKINFTPQNNSGTAEEIEYNRKQGWIDDNGCSLKSDYIIPTLSHRHYYLSKLTHGLLALHPNDVLKSDWLDALHPQPTPSFSVLVPGAPKASLGFTPLHIALRRGRDDLVQVR